MSANMDTVGTPAMHNVLSKYNLVTCPARHYLKKNQKNLKDKTKYLLAWWNWMIFLNCQRLTSGGFIGLDVANGYTIKFVDCC